MDNCIIVIGDLLPPIAAILWGKSGSWQMVYYRRSKRILVPASLTITRWLGRFNYRHSLQQLNGEEIMPHEFEVYNANLAMFCSPMPIEPIAPPLMPEPLGFKIYEPPSYIDSMSYRKTEADIYNENLDAFSKPIPIPSVRIEPIGCPDDIELYPMRSLIPDPILPKYEMKPFKLIDDDDASFLGMGKRKIGLHGID